MLPPLPIIQVADFGMSRFGNDTGYYKSNDAQIPVKWYQNIEKLFIF
jgi:hypothetical protein